MLTDAFSPPLLHQGATRRAVELLLERTSFGSRVLTKSGKVTSREFIRLYQQAP